MIDWNSECMKMTMDYIDFELDGYEPDACRGMAEALCAERLGWA